MASVVITGASGLLGRALMQVFGEESQGVWKSVTGTAFSRSGQNLIKVDLSDFGAVDSFIQKEKPDVLIHAAAQRSPDKVDKEFEAAKRLNVEATQRLTKNLKTYGGKMLYISTDYVFDGESPPFTVDSPANPINTYGELKLDGEKAALATDEENIVLRIPVLYGDVEYLGESAVTTLLQLLLDASSSEEKIVSDYEIRRPSHVLDIARVVRGLILKKIEGGDIKGIYQWCGDEPMTKFGMTKTMAELFDLKMDFIKGNAEKPQTGTKRPHDTTMDRSRVESLGIHHHTNFKQGIKSSVDKWITKK